MAGNSGIYNIQRFILKIKSNGSTVKEDVNLRGIDDISFKLNNTQATLKKGTNDHQISYSMNPLTDGAVEFSLSGESVYIPVLNEIVKNQINTFGAGTLVTFDCYYLRDSRGALNGMLEEYDLFECVIEELAYPEHSIDGVKDVSYKIIVGRSNTKQVSNAKELPSK